MSSLRHPHIRSTRSAVDVREGRREWFRIRNADAEEAAIDLFDEIGFFGITAADFQRELRAVTAPKIRLNVNSPGGDVFDAVAIFNLLRDHPAEVTAYNIGVAASAASFIPLAADRVVTARHSQWMVHDAFGLGIGNADDMRRMAEFLDKQSGVIAGIYAELAEGDVAEWRARMAAETWFTDQEAVDAGLADEIGSLEAAENRFDLSVFKHAPAVNREPQSTEPEPDLKQDDEPPGEAARREARHAVAAAELEVAGWRR